MANQESTIIVGIPANNDPDLTETVRHALGLRSRGHKLKLIVVEQTSRHGEDLASIVSCLLYTSPSPRDRTRSRMPSSA